MLKNHRRETARGHGGRTGPAVAAVLWLVIGVAAIAGPVAAQAPPARPAARPDERLLTVDHYVPVESTAPSMDGGVAQVYVRERALVGPILRARGLEERVVLFVHGAGTPAEVAFDVPFEGYSWMAYLARAGYDVFAMDMTGYGRSTRPAPMNDPCNLSEEQQADLVPLLLDAPCEPSYRYTATTIQSDWDDLDAVVDYIRARRGVDQVDLIGWSLGGPRAAGYAVRFPAKVRRVVLLAPAYSRSRRSGPPESLPVPGTTMTKQSRDDFVSLWDRQVGCPGQFEPEVREAVWGAMLDSDAVGSTWGTGVRRAPRTTVWGWGPDQVGSTSTPMLLVTGEHDGQVPPQRVRDLYRDLGSDRKVFADLACSSHNAMWETNRELLFDASLQWLRDGSVNGTDRGEIRLGY